MKEQVKELESCGNTNKAILNRLEKILTVVSIQISIIKDY